MMNIDKAEIAQSFSKAAPSYDAAAVLQAEVGERLFERLELMNTDVKKALDVGCGTGRLTRKLSKMFARAKISAVDIAPGMIAQAKSQQKFFDPIKYQLADADQLPFKDNQFDLVVSNLTLQWLPDLKVTFSELNRVLKPGGLLLFSSLGPDTLTELRQSWQQVDSGVHVNEFIDMHLVGDAMFNAGFANTVMDRDVITMTYLTLKGMLGELKAIGAHNLDNSRARGLLSKSKWQQLQQAYEAFRWEDGVFPSTWEVIFGHGWKSTEGKKLDYHTYPVDMQKPDPAKKFVPPTSPDSDKGDNQ